MHTYRQMPTTRHSQTRTRQFGDEGTGFENWVQGTQDRSQSLQRPPRRQKENAGNGGTCQQEMGGEKDQCAAYDPEPQISAFSTAWSQVVGEDVDALAEVKTSWIWERHAEVLDPRINSAHGIHALK